MIRVEGVRARSGDFTLRNVTFEVPRGGWGVVIGPAGSGKTTLIESVAGVVAIEAGRIWLDGREVTALPANARGVGLVYQHAFLFPHLTVRQNVAYGARDEATVQDLMTRLGIMELRERQVPSLSGGERQLVALARALAQRPAILLLDEPFSALDPRRRAITRRLVRDLHREWRMTILQVTHDFTEAGFLGDVSVLLDAGQVLQSGPTADVFRKPATAYVAEFLGAENVLAGDVTGEAVIDGGLRAVEFRCEGLLLVAVSDAPVGPCHAVIRGEEVIVSRTPQASSARNHFSGVVRDVGIMGAYARVSVEVQGVPFVALLTLPSLRELALDEGEFVHLTFKAFAVHLC